MRGRNLDAIRAAFEMHGIEFIDSTGVRASPALKRQNQASDRAVLRCPERRAGSGASPSKYGVAFTDTIPTSTSAEE